MASIIEELRQMDQEELLRNYKLCVQNEALMKIGNIDATIESKASATLLPLIEQELNARLKAAADIGVSLDDIIINTNQAEIERFPAVDGIQNFFQNPDPDYKIDPASFCHRLRMLVDQKVTLNKNQIAGIGHMLYTYLKFNEKIDDVYVLNLATYINSCK
ncbi:MAG: hypothetical protein WCP93_02975 [Candidatus Berkelbacteria bacterium]